mgnify:CR=1 FL=1
MMPQETIIRTAVRAAAFDAGVSADPAEFDINMMPYMIERTELILRDTQMWGFLVDHGDMNAEYIFDNLFNMDAAEWTELYGQGL